MTSTSSAGALEAVERILNRGGEPDAVLRDVVRVLHERTGCWFAIGDIASGPTPHETQRHQVLWEGAPVAELTAAAEADPALCARVALLVSPYCRKG
jgi:hypothetical protein